MLYRLKQVFLQLGMIIIVLLYTLMIFIFWIILFLGSFVWKKEPFEKMLNFYFDCIPSITDINGDNALDQLRDNKNN